MKKSAMWITLELNAVKSFKSITLQNDIELVISLKCSAIGLCMKRSVDHAGEIKMSQSENFLSGKNPSFVFNSGDAVWVDRCLLTFSGDWYLNVPGIWLLEEVFLKILVADVQV